MIIYLTGNISTGKSTVCKYIIDKYKFSYISLDEISHIIMTDLTIINELCNVFGEDILDKDLITNSIKINRHRLGRAVWGNKEKIDILNNIVHPKIKKVFNETLNKKKELNENILVEHPLILNEPISRKEFEKYFPVIATTSKKQLQWLMKRDNIDEEYALIKINSQISIEDSFHKPHFIIDTSEKNIFEQIDKILNYLNINNRNFTKEEAKEHRKAISKLFKFNDIYEVKK